MNIFIIFIVLIFIKGMYAQSPCCYSPPLCCPSPSCPTCPSANNQFIQDNFIPIQ
uniref:Uncharacterized protein n=2 Tax=Meloidogyne TaxID=189290 RepID=A0A6V7UCQ2_MELEN|nr:unnamed protein product [Meloidogyne enterolobii]